MSASAPQGRFKTAMAAFEREAGEPSPMGRAALVWAQRGVCVFPCSARDKRPLIPGGVSAASSMPEQVLFWWTLYPLAMIGGACGPRSRFWAVDLDVGVKTDRDGVEYPVDGPAVWATLCADHGGAPRTFWQATPSGGRHLLFRWRDGLAIRNSAGSLGAAPSPSGAPRSSGVDTRGEGGYGSDSAKRGCAPWRDEPNAGMGDRTCSTPSLRPRRSPPADRTPTARR